VVGMPDAAVQAADRYVGPARGAGRHLVEGGRDRVGLVVDRQRRRVGDGDHGQAHGGGRGRAVDVGDLVGEAVAAAVVRRRRVPEAATGRDRDRAVRRPGDDRPDVAGIAGGRVVGGQLAGEGGVFVAGERVVGGDGDVVDRGDRQRDRGRRGGAVDVGDLV